MVRRAKLSAPLVTPPPFPPPLPCPDLPTHERGRVAGFGRKEALLAAIVPTSDSEEEHMLRIMRLADEGGDEDCVCSVVLPTQPTSGEQGISSSSFSLMFHVFHGGLRRVAAESSAASCASLLQDISLK